MTDENPRYGEYECGAPGCSAVFMDADVRDGHYRRAHTDESGFDGAEREHEPPLRREELINPDE